MFKIATITLVSLALLAGCSTQMPGPTVEDPAQPVEIGARGDRYLRGGPTTKVDIMAEAQAQTEVTTLQLLEEKSLEVQRLREESKQWQAKAAAAEAQLATSQGSSARRDEEVDRLRKLLANALADQKELSESLLSARIECLQLKKQLIKGKLADLASAGAGR